MVQPMDNSMIRPNYNAVKINIKKPEINAGNNLTTLATDNGIYNAVNIEIDNPTVNTEPKKIYDYPIMEGPVTYDMAGVQQVPLPRGFHVAYQTTNVILPKMENEIEIEKAISNVEKDVLENLEEDNAEEVEAEEIPIPVDETTGEDTQTVQIKVPEPKFTTVGEEKGLVEPKNEDINKTAQAEIKPEEIEKANEVNPMRPEIIPGEEILPEVDIPLIVENLTSKDFDTQAQQMEEIARISLDNPANAVPYIVREVFASLIDTTKADTSNLATPTNAQIDARRKIIANVIATETAKANNQPLNKLPYQLTELEIGLANELSPMEMAERNKEYALYTIAILAKVYTDEVEKQTGNIVPITDVPGTSAMVDALRYNPNSGVKIAAIDALSYIQRPEYKQELTTLFSLAQVDNNPQVALTAQMAMDRLNNI